MKQLPLVLVSILVSIASNAQTSKDSIVNVIHDFFRGMKSADTTLLQSTLSPTAVLQTIREKEGGVSVEAEKISEFIDFVGQQKAGDADERIEVETVKSDGQLASVWTPYQFYYKGKFSHCGVNSFQLVKMNGAWKIQYIIDTRKQTGCKQ